MNDFFHWLFIKLLRRIWEKLLKYIFECFLKINEISNVNIFNFHKAWKFKDAFSITLPHQSFYYSS